jgi:hypothetical protein
MISANGPGSPLLPKLVKLWSFAATKKYVLHPPLPHGFHLPLRIVNRPVSWASVESNVPILALNSFKIFELFSRNMFFPRMHRVNIVGDFNESLEEEGPLFNLQEDFDLSDAMDACVGHSSFNTYAQGSSRIDFVLCSPDVLPAI